MIDMTIKFYHIILAVKILGWFLLKWAGFGELLGWEIIQPDLATLAPPLAKTASHINSHRHIISMSIQTPVNIEQEDRT